MYLFSCKCGSRCTIDIDWETGKTLYCPNCNVRYELNKYLKIEDINAIGLKLNELPEDATMDFKIKF